MVIPMMECPPLPNIRPCISVSLSPNYSPRLIHVLSIEEVSKGVDMKQRMTPVWFVYHLTNRRKRKHMVRRLVGNPGSALLLIIKLVEETINLW